MLELLDFCTISRKPGNCSNTYITPIFNFGRSFKLKKKKILWLGSGLNLDLHFETSALTSFLRLWCIYLGPSHTPRLVSGPTAMYLPWITLDSSPVSLSFTPDILALGDVNGLICPLFHMFFHFVSPIPIKAASRDRTLTSIFF